MADPREQPTHNLPERVMLALSLGQGAAMFALYRAEDAGVWPATERLWSMPLWTLVIAAPLAALLTAETGHIRGAFLRVGVLALGLGICAAYTGYMTMPETVYTGSITFIFSLCMIVATFKGVLFVQRSANHLLPGYATFFRYSWRNFLTTSLALLLVAGFALLLVLWASLFAVVGIEFFRDLFTEDWFLFPVLSLAFGFGVVVFRRLTHIIDSITRLLEGLVRLLLPLFALLAVTFLATLPFVGLQPLWDTNRGTGLLMALMAGLLFTVNAVYQTGTEDSTYPRPIQALVALSMLTLPVLAALSLYGLLLRVGDYGWTVARLWALLVWVLLATFSAGYAWGVIRHRLGWPMLLARTNSALGIIVLAAVLAASSPILDFRTISLASQTARVADGHITWHEFDFNYLQQQLGRPGWQLVEQLKQEYPDDDRLHALMINPYVRGEPPEDVSVLDIATRIDGPFELPEGAADALLSVADYWANGELFLLRRDLNRDGQDEFVLIETAEHNVRRAWFAEQLPDGRWQAQYLQAFGGQSAFGNPRNPAEALQRGEATVTRPQYDEIIVDQITLRVITPMVIQQTPQGKPALNPAQLEP